MLGERHHWTTQNFQKQNRRGRWSEISSAWGDDGPWVRARRRRSPRRVRMPNDGGWSLPACARPRKFFFLRNGLRGQSADNPCGWADPSTPPLFRPYPSRHHIFSHSPVPLSHTTSSPFITSPQLPGSSLSPLTNFHHSIPQCETRNKHRPSRLFAFLYGALGTRRPSTPPSPSLTRHVFGETQAQGRRDTSQRNHTMELTGCATHHISPSPSLNGLVVGNSLTDRS